MRVMSPETEQVLDELVALAHGNVELVRQALARGGAAVQLSEVVEYINRNVGPNATTVPATPQRHSMS